jgi:hypothetical protein
VTVEQRKPAVRRTLRQAATVITLPLSAGCGKGSDSVPSLPLLPCARAKSADALLEGWKRDGGVSIDPTALKATLCEPITDKTPPHDRDVLIFDVPLSRGATDRAIESQLVAGGWERASMQYLWSQTYARAVDADPMQIRTISFTSRSPTMIPSVAGTRERETALR